MYVHEYSTAHGTRTRRTTRLMISNIGRALSARVIVRVLKRFYYSQRLEKLVRPEAFYGDWIYIYIYIYTLRVSH